MDKLFLVKNIEDEGDNGTILDICTTREIADILAAEYANNFTIICNKVGEECVTVEELIISDCVDVIWTMYPEDTIKGIRYAQ